MITGALKLFFRELPEPLFPFSHFRQFIAAISERLGGRGRGLGQGRPAAATPWADPSPPTGLQPLSSPRRADPPFPRAAGPGPALPVCAGPGALAARPQPRHAAAALPAPVQVSLRASRGNGEAGTGGAPHTHPPKPPPALGPDPHPLSSPLCRVIDHGNQNRMSVQSVAIVFGPTLLRPETEETSMPMTMVFQNQVVELILQRCSDIFPPH